jgi:hypothetical protein
MTLLLIIIVLLAIGGLGTGPYWGYSRGWGWGPSGLIWALFVIVLIWALMGGRL